MSKEYIERGALIKTLRGSSLAKYPRSFAMGLIAAADEAVKQPIADVVEVKHGEWDYTGRYKFPGGSVAVRCSECGCCLTAGEYRMNVWNYCPVCGARMDGGADNVE